MIAQVFDAVRWIRPAVAFPVLAQVRSYRAEWLVNDLGAGIAVAAVALPIGIAYPEIAGLPPQAGLYATILALIGYALFGPSRQLIVGPDAATMTVVAAALAQLAVTGADARVAVAAALAVAVGILCLAAAACRLGFIADFLSRPVLIGYLCGISLALLGSQITRFTTVPIESPGLIRPLVELSGQVNLVHWPTLMTGAVTFLLVRMLRWLAPRAPGPLAALVFGIVLAIVFDLRSWGVDLLGPIDDALPRPVLPAIDVGQLDDMVLSALSILMVAFGSGIVTARSFGAKARHRVDPNRELVGFGSANLASGFFGGFPVTGADSRTAICHVTGGRTQLAGLIAALALVVALLVLGGVLQYLPILALGAVLASAAIDLFDIGELRQLWRISRAELLLALIAMAGVVALGVLKGVIIAMAATGIYVLAREARPRDALLGRIPGKEGLYKLHLEPRATPVPGLALYLVQGAVLFFNSDYIRNRVRWIVSRLPETTRWFVFDAGAVSDIDSTAAATIDDLRSELNRRNIRFGIANLHSQPRKLLRNAGVLAGIGPQMVFERIEDAVTAFQREEAPPKTVLQPVAGGRPPF